METLKKHFAVVLTIWYNLSFKYIRYGQLFPCASAVALYFNFFYSVYGESKWKIKPEIQYTSRNIFIEFVTKPAARNPSVRLVPQKSLLSFLLRASLKSRHFVQAGTV